MSTSHGRILVFAREPCPGKVKTRLISALGANEAAALYARLLEGSLQAAAGVEGTRAELWCACEGGEPIGCEELAKEYGLDLFLQQGANLGDRMFSAFSAEAPTAKCPAILIGSDCPEYSAEYLAQAFAGLADGDAVLGPATDGGYVLIGLNRVDRRLFTDIPWGSSNVLEMTRLRLRELGWRWTELPPLRDIDQPSDLAHFPELLSGFTSLPEGFGI